MAGGGMVAAADQPDGSAVRRATDGKPGQPARTVRADRVRDRAAKDACRPCRRVTCRKTLTAGFGMGSSVLGRLHGHRPAGERDRGHAAAVRFPDRMDIVRFRGGKPCSGAGAVDKRVVALFVIVLFLPMLAGLAWLLPSVLNPASWAARDFTLESRLLTEARVVCDYLVWTLLPTPHALSFYHDDLAISASLFSPWTTAASIAVLAALAACIPYLRRRQPLVALGIGLFLGGHVLTATILPLELVFEHRNYFPSFGVLLAIVPWLTTIDAAASFKRARWFALGALLLAWTGQTAITASSWGHPLLLAETLAARAPDSPRAQYELGRTYIVLSRYDVTSPFATKMVAPLERAATLPHASILPEQALIFAYARMHMPIKDAWWDSLIAKLKARRPGVQDESSLGALTKCSRDGLCDLPRQRMTDAYLAALSHPKPATRILASYADYAWNVLGDRTLGLSMAREAVASQPSEPAYHVTLARMLAAEGRHAEARQQIKALEALNYGGRLDADIAGLRAMVGESGE